MKKLMITILSLGIIVTGGYYYARSLVTDKVVEVVNTPEVQKEIAKAIASIPKEELHVDELISTNKEALTQLPTTPQAKEKLNGKAKSSQPKMTFKTQEEAVDYAVSKVTKEEAAKYMDAYQNRDSLAPSEVEKLKKEAISKFTPEELEAMSEALTKK